MRGSNPDDNDPGVPQKSRALLFVVVISSFVGDTYRGGKQACIVVEYFLVLCLARHALDEKLRRDLRTAPKEQESPKAKFCVPLVPVWGRGS